MKRLTEKGKFSEPYDSKYATECINKLGKLEDLMEKYKIEDIKMLEKIIIRHDMYNKLEEQIGCPLEVREQAFNNGFYDENGEHYICEHYVPYLKSMHTRGLMYGTSKKFKLCDYKKTWWLKEDKSE